MWRIFFLFAASWIGTPIIAQTSAAVAVARPLSVLNEHYDASHAQTAGGVLVGVLLGGREPEAFDPAKVRFKAPPDSNQIICVRGISQDGLYWTRTPYLVDARGVSDANEIELEPFTETKAPFTSRVALLAFLSETDRCDEGGATVLPERRESETASTLHAAVNSGGRKVAVKLVMNTGAVDGTCVPINDGGRVAFNFICRIPVPPGAAAAEPVLEVTLDNRLTKTSIQHPLRLNGK